MHTTGPAFAARALPRGPRLALALVLAVLATVPASPVASQDVAFPEAEWERVPGDGLVDYGWSPEGLQAVFEHVRDSSVATGVVVVDRGRIVFRFGDVEDLSYVASVRKSILAILYGRYVEDGTIDLDATLADLGMDDVDGLLDVEKQATVEHLITARSGVYHPASNSGDNLADAPPRGSQRPGEYMLYSNWDFNAAGAAFERETGVDIHDALEEQLAVPLRLEHWDRSVQRKSGDPSRSRNLAYHMWLSTLDMARIGHLALHRGRWHDEQLVPEAWMKRITGVVTPLEEMNPERLRDGYLGYGAMWWVFDGPRAVGPFEGAFTARGAWGQWITVLPAVDLVVAHKTNSVYRRTASWESWERMLELILEARGVEMDGTWPWG